MKTKIKAMANTFGGAVMLVPFVAFFMGFDFELWYGVGCFFVGFAIVGMGGGFDRKE